jgi:hypothetical protein
MRTENIKLAVIEAERFIVLANKCIAERKADKMCEIVGTALSGGTKRASLDLTRLLAIMRKP